MPASTDYAQQIIDMYANLQQKIFEILINALQSSKIKNVTADNVLQWQIEQLSKAGMLTNQVIKLVAQVNHQSVSAINQMCNQLGVQAVSETQSEIHANTTKTGNISPDSRPVIDSYINQTKSYLGNTINETLLTRNTQVNAATRVFRDIVTKSSLEVTNGLKTHEQAVRDKTYRWVEKGIPTKLSDSAGRGWSLESYSRLVVENTSRNVFNELRRQTMNVNGLTLAKMSWHPCARPACAPIQGHIVNMIPPSDPKYNAKYDSIYNHGYGEAGGTLGINCKHIFTPFDPDINIFHLDKDMPSPSKAVKQSEMQQRQRALERAIRQQKKKLSAAQEMHDQNTVSAVKSTIFNQQAKIRDLVKNNSFLTRDYSREQVQSK
jgi:hypothetical protein